MRSTRASSVGITTEKVNFIVDADIRSFSLFSACVCLRRSLNFDRAFETVETTMSWEMPIMARLLTTGGILGSVLARLLLISQWDHHAARLSKLRQSTAANAGLRGQMAAQTCGPLADKDAVFG